MKKKSENKKQTNKWKINKQKINFRDPIDSEKHSDLISVEPQVANLEIWTLANIGIVAQHWFRNIRIFMGKNLSFP